MGLINISNIDSLLLVMTIINSLESLFFLQSGINLISAPAMMPLLKHMCYCQCMRSIRASLELVYLCKLSPYPQCLSHSV